MDIKTMKYFLEVAREENITRAAEKLCIAQPPLSRQMKLLEEELGVTLFVRGKRRIQLTEEGYYLRQRAEEIITLLEKTEKQLERMGKKDYGTVSIAATETCGAGILSELIENFHRKAPNVRYQIWSGSGDEVRERLEKSLVDVGIVREPFNMENYDRAFLRTESWIAVLGKDHPLAKRSKDGIQLAWLKDEPLMIPSRQTLQTEINSWFNEIASERNIFCTYNTVSSVIGMAENNFGIAICPESAVRFMNRETLVYRKLICPEHKSRVFLVRKRFQVMPTTADMFWNYVLEYVGAEPEE